jgi:hypothetical protein
MIALRSALSGIRFSFAMLIILGMVSFAPVRLQKIVYKGLVVCHDKFDPLTPFFQDKEYFGNIPLGIFCIFISFFLLCFYSFLIVKIISCTARWIWSKAKHGEARG